MTDLAIAGAPKNDDLSQVFSYLTSPNHDRYRRIMHCLLHRRTFRLRLSTDRITSLLWDLHQYRPQDSDEVENDLAQLHRWGAVERQQDTSAAASTADFKRKRYTYDITAAGEIAERASQALASSQRRIGALERGRLLGLLGDLEELVAVARQTQPDGQRLLLTLESLHAKLVGLRDSASDFMRDLGHVMSFEDGISEDAFSSYKTKVIDHLRGFKAEQTRVEPRIRSLIAEIEAADIKTLCSLAAASEQPPRYQMTADEVASARTHALLQQWNVVLYWFTGDENEPAPWRELDRSLADAIAWIVATAQRFIDRRAQRVDRSAEYRSLARLFAGAPTIENCHELHAAVFSLHSPRHLSVKEDDPELTPPSVSWWNGRPATIEAHLRKPTSRDPGAGRTASIKDYSNARHLLRERLALERVELERARARFADRGALNMADFGELQWAEFKHLLGWVGRASESSRSADGTKIADSADGSVRIALSLPRDGKLGETIEPTVELCTAAGTLKVPNFAVQITSL